MCIILASKQLLETSKTYMVRVKNTKEVFTKQTAALNRKLNGGYISKTNIIRSKKVKYFRGKCYQVVAIEIIFCYSGNDVISTSLVNVNNICCLINFAWQTLD